MQLLTNPRLSAILLLSTSILAMPITNSTTTATIDTAASSAMLFKAKHKQNLAPIIEPIPPPGSRCELIHPAPANATCGKVGKVLRHDHHIQQFYDPRTAPPPHIKPENCAAECAADPDCKSFLVNKKTREEGAFPVCVMHMVTLDEGEFDHIKSENNKGYDKECWFCPRDL